MTERTNLAALRTWAKRKDRPNPVMVEFPTVEVLALIDVVEAAQSFVHGTYRGRRETIDTSAHGELLRDALDRFDGFGASE